jgi:hypothetical protein
MVGETVFTGDTGALAEVRAQAADAVIALTWRQRCLPDAATLGRVLPQYVNQPHNLLDAPAAAAIHEAGLLVCTYTVDDQDEMRRMTDIGADAITSNEIGLLVATLQDRPGSAATGVTADGRRYARSSPAKQPSFGPHGTAPARPLGRRGSPAAAAHIEGSRSYTLEG